MNVDQQLDSGSVLHRIAPIQSFMERPHKFRYLNGSNEAGLDAVFPVLSAVEGSIVGVSPENMLDLLANTPLESATIIDFQEDLLLAYKGVLELSLLYKTEYGKYPTTDQLLYLIDLSAEEQQELLGQKFSTEETRRVILALHKDGWPAQVSLNQFFQVKRKISYSWIGSDARIAKVTSAYENRMIDFVLADVTDAKSMRQVSDFARKNSRNYAVVYLSNLKSGFGVEKFSDNLDANIRLLPIKNDAILIEAKQSSDEGADKSLLQLDENDTLADRLFVPWRYNVYSLTND